MNTTEDTNATRRGSECNALLGLVKSLREWSDGPDTEQLVNKAADEIERLRGLIAELLDTELAELACAGSHAPVEDILGRLRDALKA